MGTVLWNSLLSLVLLLLVLLLFCSSRADEVVTVDVHAARHLLRSGHRYLDVRTEEEFKKGHVENSLNIPYMFNTPQGRVKNQKFMEQVSAACGKEEKLVVGCQSGVRSLYATTDLTAHVSNMGGGYEAWLESGFAVNKPQDEL
ncbi:thiosulfate sulfurtransferase 18-like isoform X2 [Nicotiana tabacum]|uniref:Thiosulfate sulfurtransferase 18-like isoform X2 n=1 Tax=Nicotiana tabacum TaxID=4097 RepID=A0A1S3XLC5_TOBAC|nr:PREDICTED: thiosulfate sulfurtransferase 18-like isoform X2 [Nicotiana tabacum]